MVVLDTSFLIDHLAGDETATEVLRILQQQTGEIGVSTISLVELYAGIGRSTQPDREKQAVDGLISSLLTFPLGPGAARQAGLLDAQMAQAGEPIPALDLLLAATAVHEGQALVTRDRRHFDRVPGLETLHY